MDRERQLAPEEIAELPPFEHPDVQKVYELLCDMVRPPEGNHWEGLEARRIVSALGIERLRKALESIMEYPSGHAKSIARRALRQQEDQ